MCAIYRNRQIYLNTILFVILSVPMLFISYIYDFIGQDVSISENAAIYIWIVLPSLYFFAIGTCIGLFATAQRKPWIMTTATVSSAIVHAVCVFLFYYVFDWGFYGICIATNLHFMTRFTVNYVLVYKCGYFVVLDDVSLFMDKTTEGYEDQLSTCLNSTAMGVWGWWAFDIFTLIASYLHAVVIAAQTILRSIGLITYMLPVGIL